MQQFDTQVKRDDIASTAAAYLRNQELRNAHTALAAAIRAHRQALLGRDYDKSGSRIAHLCRKKVAAEARYAAAFRAASLDIPHAPKARV